MKLFLFLAVNEGDDTTRIIEALCDTLTQARFLKPDETLVFHTVGPNIVVYRTSESKCPYKLEPYDAIGGD